MARIFTLTWPKAPPAKSCLKALVTSSVMTRPSGTARSMPSNGVAVSTSSRTLGTLVEVGRGQLAAEFANIARELDAAGTVASAQDVVPSAGREDVRLGQCHEVERCRTASARGLELEQAARRLQVVLDPVM